MLVFFAIAKIDMLNVAYPPCYYHPSTGMGSIAFVRNIAYFNFKAF